jgi:putative transcriptional regulator
MNKDAFESMKRGLEDARAFIAGDTSRGRVAAGPDVKAIRERTRLSQAKFADALHISVATVRDWEQHRRMPDRPARALLGMVEAEPEAALRILAKVCP